MCVRMCSDSGGCQAVSLMSPQWCGEKGTRQLNGEEAGWYLSGAKSGLASEVSKEPQKQSEEVAGEREDLRAERFFRLSFPRMQLGRLDSGAMASWSRTC